MSFFISSISPQLLPLDMPCDHSFCLFSSELSKNSIIFWLSLNGGKGVSYNPWNYGQKSSKKCPKIQGFFANTSPVLARTTEIIGKNPQIIRNEKKPCPPFNENQNIIEYLESSDGNKQNEWSQGISTGNSYRNIENNNIIKIATDKTILVKIIIYVITFKLFLFL